MKNRTRNKKDGLYHIKVGKKTLKFPKLYGSRAEVMHDTAYSTSSGKTKKYFKYNKHGRIVSKLQSMYARKNKHLAKAGYTFKKGVFGAYKKVGNTLKSVVRNKKNQTMKKKTIKKKK